MKNSEYREKKRIIKVVESADVIVAVVAQQGLQPL